MNEAEANRQLKELASARGKTKLDAQDYRRQRRLILARFSKSECAAMEETMEWHEPERRDDATVEMDAPAGGEDTSELKIDKTRRSHKMAGVIAIVLLLGVVFLTLFF